VPGAATLTVRVPVQLLGDLRHLARHRSCTLTEVVQNALEREISIDVEDFHETVTLDGRYRAEWRAQKMHPKVWAEQHEQQQTVNQRRRASRSGNPATRATAR
jgi:predicted DNA-binding protein